MRKKLSLHLNNHAMKTYPVLR